MSSLPQTPNRRAAYPQVPRTPPLFVPTNIPQSAPPAHYQAKPSNTRRQSSNSTITASSVDEEEAFTDREEDDVPESQASQMARNLLQRAPPTKGHDVCPTISPAKQPRPKQNIRPSQERLRSNTCRRAKARPHALDSGSPHSDKSAEARTRRSRCRSRHWRLAARVEEHCS